MLKPLPYGKLWPISVVDVNERSADGFFSIFMLLIGDRSVRAGYIIRDCLRVVADAGIRSSSLGRIVVKRRERTWDFSTAGLGSIRSR